MLQFIYIAYELTIPLLSTVSNECMYFIFWHGIHCMRLPKISDIFNIFYTARKPLLFSSAKDCQWPKMFGYFSVNCRSFKSTFMALHGRYAGQHEKGGALNLITLILMIKSSCIDGHTADYEQQ